VVASADTETDDAAPAAEGPTQLDEVEVTGRNRRDDVKSDTATIGKVATPLRDVPQSVTVINRAMLNAQGATSLADALRNVPGITQRKGARSATTSTCVASRRAPISSSTACAIAASTTATHSSSTRSKC
jgi:outer membrane receptor for monomeric catechols